MSTSSSDPSHRTGYFPFEAFPVHPRPEGGVAGMFLRPTGASAVAAVAVVAVVAVILKP